MNSGTGPKFLKPGTTFEAANVLLDRTPSDENCSQFVFNRNLRLSIRQQRERLPIYRYRLQILYLLEKYQTVLLVGETGCGKSTQVPQFVVEAKWPDQVGVCEPRRVAAVSLANRVAAETNTMVQSDTVGYAVRFDACVNQPRIKYMTEGILIREMMSDPLLKSYSVLMLDEVHERTMYTDILMGLMKKILKKRPELRLIVASATMDTAELFDFFNVSLNGKDSAIILPVEGRQFTVRTLYVAEPIPCYVQKSIDTVLAINKSKEGGDILVFLTGQDEVETVVRQLRDYKASESEPHLVPLPLYGSLPFHEQLKVFKPVSRDIPNVTYRKVVVATNIAETSVTIPDIVHVIDCGHVKMRWFNRETHTDSLIVLPVSKASARQRAGRAGRHRAGTVYRLYPEASDLPDCTPPEIVRTQITYAILQLKALGIGNVLKFDLPTPPPIENLKSALEILYALNAIDLNGNLTHPLGYRMAEFSLDPIYSKILLDSNRFQCTNQVLTIISMLQVECIFTKPSSGSLAIKARVQKRNFEVAEGDLLTYLNVYNAFVQSEQSRTFCHQNFISYKGMKRVVEVRQRLEKTLRSYGVVTGDVAVTGTTDDIVKCLVSGLFPNAAYLHYTGVYRTLRGDVDLYISPDSVLYTVKQPQWVVFCEVTHTNKLYMRDLTAIQSQWLLDLAPHFYYKT